MDIKNKIILALQKNELSEIEKDILLEDLRSLYTLLKNEDKEIPSKVITKTESTTYSPPVFKEVEKPEINVAPLPTKNVNHENTIKKENESQKEVKLEINPKTNNDINTTFDPLISIDINDKFKNQSTSDVNEQFKKELTSINKSHFKNIADLVDLNTRIYLSKSLFSNNMNLLLVFIEELDKRPNLGSAMDYLHDELGDGNDENAIGKIRELVISKFN